MYTVVLMAALTSGSAAPDWHPRGGHGHVGHGCYGCYGGWSCYGSPTGVGYLSIDSAMPRTNIEVPPAIAPVVPPAPMAPKIQETPLPKQAQIRSNVIIEVPENAKLYVDDML